MPTRLKTPLNTIIHHQYANSQILINSSRFLDHDFQCTQHVSWWDRTAVYVNVGAMASLAVAVGILNFKNPPKNRR